MLEDVHAAPSADDDFRARLLNLIPQLRAFAHTLCRNRDVAEDLAQEAVANAWQARASFQPGTNMRAWLFVIQRNAFYSAYRRRAREAGWDDRAMERVLVTGASQQASVELTDLKRAMSLLPDEQREAMILVGAGGFTHSEAAAICRCAVGTVKSRVSRARSAIAALMTQSTPLPKPSARAGSAYESITRELAELCRRGAFIPKPTFGLAQGAAL